MRTLYRATSVLKTTTIAVIATFVGAVAGIALGGVFGFRLGVVVATADEPAPGCVKAYKPAHADGEPILVPVEVCVKRGRST